MKVSKSAILLSASFALLLCGCGKSDPIDFSYELTGDGTARITGYYGEETDVIEIPEKIDGYKVTDVGIGTNGFCVSGEEAEELEKIVLPDGIESVDIWAIGCAKEDIEMEIPDSVKTLWPMMGFGTDKTDLPDFIDVDDEFVIVGDGVLVKYTGDDEIVEVPEDVKYIDPCAFVSDKVKEVELPDSVKEIRPDAFLCRSLEDVSIPDGALIWYGAFGDTDHINPFCQSFDEYNRVTGVIPSDNIDKFDFSDAEEDDGFYITDDGVLIAYCSDSVNSISIDDIDIPDSVKEIAPWVFANHTNLHEVDIPDSVEKIGMGAFMNCIMLEKVSLPEKLEIIEPWTFNGYYKGYMRLNKISLPESVKSIGSEAFYETSVDPSKVLKNSNVEVIGGRAFAVANNDKNRAVYSKLELPDGMRSVGAYCFADMMSKSEFDLSLKLDIPKSVSIVGYNAFSENIKQFDVGHRGRKTLIGIEYRCFASEINYAGSEKQFDEIRGVEQFEDCDVEFK